jgi:DMSO/TMAO reductase YedYZ molybdopterin-dependent catalytic subunit
LQKVAGMTRHFSRALEQNGADRRKFLKTMALSAGSLAWGGLSGMLRADEKQPPGLILREKDPENLEFPFASLDSFLTPNKLFYVRNHFSMPSLDEKTWRLRVTGAVGKPLELTYADILNMAARTLPVTLECVGNGRSFLEPKAKGVQWELGAVSTAEWTGVTLASILEKAELKKEAVDVVLEGADSGTVKNEPKPEGKLHFARSLPLAKAMKPEVLLAHRMNGEALSKAHGFPLRAVAGGWYGMASVKWLTRIVVTDKPFHGYDQTTDYGIWERRDGLPTLTPITSMEVKASIAQPVAGATIPAGNPYRIHGAAWAGESDVSKVEVSTDGGKTWVAAKLIDEAKPFCWRRWEYAWDKPAAGRHRLMARAVDKQGKTQPTERDPDRRNYMINHVIPVEVQVRG